MLEVNIWLHETEDAKARKKEVQGLILAWGHPNPHKCKAQLRELMNCELRDQYSSNGLNEII